MDEILGQRLRLAFELHDAGVDMMRMRFRRQFPQETPEQIEERLESWLCDVPLHPGRLRSLDP